MTITIDRQCTWCEYRSDLTLVRKHEEIAHPEAAMSFKSVMCKGPCGRNACFDGCGYPPIVFDDGSILQTPRERISTQIALERSNS